MRGLQFPHSLFRWEYKSESWRSSKGIVQLFLICLHLVDVCTTCCSLFIPAEPQFVFYLQLLQVSQDSFNYSTGVLRMEMNQKVIYGVIFVRSNTISICNQQNFKIKQIFPEVSIFQEKKIFVFNVYLSLAGLLTITLAAL